MTPTTPQSSLSQTPVTLELTGPLERLIGAPVIELPAVAHLGELLASLVERYPQAESHLSASEALRRGQGPLPPGFLIIRDGAAVPARLETTVASGDRLTLLSFLSGG